MGTCNSAQMYPCNFVQYVNCITWEHVIYYRCREEVINVKKGKVKRYEKNDYYVRK